jgi:hypothetical protein
MISKMSEKEKKNSEEFYVVEKIVDHKDVRGKRKYFLKWKGYPDSENTWEDEDGLHCYSLLQDYYFRLTGRTDAYKEHIDSQITAQKKQLHKIIGARRESNGPIQYAVTFQGSPKPFKIPSSVMREKYLKQL